VEPAIALPGKSQTGFKIVERDGNRSGLAIDSQSFQFFI
jgi:hypothetical protein